MNECCLRLPLILKMVFNCDSRNFQVDAGDWNIMGKVESFFRYCFVLFSILVIAVKCAYLFNIVPFALAAAGTFGIVVICVSAFIFWQRVYDAFSSKLTWINRLSYRKMLIIIALFSLVTKLLAVLILHIESLNDGSDIDVYVTAAYELGTTGTATSHAGYLYSFSHMFWFGVFLSPVAGIFGISQTAFSVYLSIVLTVSAVLLFSAFSEQAGKNKAFVVLMIFNALPGTILLPQYITHEIVLLFFESIAVWLYFKCLPRFKNSIAQILIYFLFAVALFAAVTVNAAGLVMCVAFLLLFFVHMLKKINRKSITNFVVKSVALVVVILLGSPIADSIQKAHSNIPDDYIRGDKILWTLYVGGNAEHNGAWNIDDANEFNSYDKDLSYGEIQEFRKEKVADRYYELLSRPAEVTHLIKEKLITVWGVFGYSILYTNENIPDQHLQKIYNLYLDRPLLLLEYLISVLAGIVCLAEVIRHRTKSSEYVLLIQLYLMGTTAMLMLTECRNKYTIAIQPFFYIACFALSEKSESKAITD